MRKRNQICSAFPSGPEQSYGLAKFEFVSVQIAAAMTHQLKDMVDDGIEPNTMLVLLAANSCKLADALFAEWEKRKEEGGDK